MPNREFACVKIPVEIWREVFLYYMSPPLLQQPSMQDYRAFPPDSDFKLLYKFRLRERKRTVLKLVSRSWKLIADEVSDRIVFVHPSRLHVPPQYPIAQADQIIISPCTPLDYNSLPGTIDRGTVKDHKFWASLPLKLGEEVPLTQIIRVNCCNIVVPDNPMNPRPPQDIVRVLYWAPFSDSPNALTHETFKSLVSLHIAPGAGSSSSSSLEVSPLYLPKLRFFHIFATRYSVDYLSQWHFPILAQLCLFCEEGSSASIGKFLNRHAETIETLRVFHKEDPAVLSSCSNGLPRLKTFVVETFEEFHTVSSLLNNVLRGSTTGSMSVCDDYIIVQLLIPSDIWDVERLIESLPRQVQEMKKKIRFEMCDTWGDMLKELPNWEYREEMHNLVQVSKSIPDNVFDSEGASWHSNAARAFEIAVVHQHDKCFPKRG
ncbi:hypothetical protein PIIN_08702 [Serendipita indica DSM 11827]|uniref:F-box domain-containing protein n=1 Tax=Serendipita indica (strain DSM 11827) TaxID=1109443 RepID=G4TTV1_SERID|nr:hypothetical protein PIIN_08702 [Serendipita indica DSM 11827]